MAELHPGPPPVADDPCASAASELRSQAELTALAEIGRALLQAQLDEVHLCERIYELAGQIVPTDNFQLGLLEGDHFEIKVWFRDGMRQPPATFTLQPGEGIIGWMRQSKLPLLVGDFETEMDTLPARPRYLSQHPPRAGAYLPLIVGDDVIGSLSIQSYTPHAFNESHMRLLAVLANQSASAIHNARLYARNQRRLNDLTAISEVGRRLTSILDLDELLTQVVETIAARFGYYHVQIFLVERGSARAYFKASASSVPGAGQDLNERWRRTGRSMRVGREGIVGWVAQHGAPLLANDVRTEPRYIPDDPRLLPDTRSELAVPLTVEGQVLGVLDAQSTAADAFGPDDIFILRTLADQVAVAVNSAYAFQAQREEAWITTVMLQVSEVTSQATSTGDVLDSAARVIAMLAGVEACILWLWDEDLAAFRLGAQYGLALDKLGAETDPAAALRFVSGEWSALDWLRAERTPLTLQISGDSLPDPLGRVCPGDMLALLPMLNQGQVIGVLGAVFGAEGAPAPGERRLAMLGGLAQQVASAVDNSRLAAAREEETWISTVLLQVAEAMRRLQPVETTLAQVAQLAPPLTGVDRCAILLRDELGDFHLRTVHAPRPELTEPYRNAVIRPGELPLLDDACRLGQPLVVDDTHDSPLVPPAWRERYGSRTLLVVPLLVADEVIGVLLADDVETTHMFSPRRVRILSGIASQAAVAVENARLQAQEAERIRLGRELELAHDIQRNLLPQAAPQPPGYEIVYRWRSAREVGGDFFDFIPLAGDRLGLLIADVADKGIPAALYMMFARTTLRAVALSGREPAAMLARTNALMLADSSAEMFVTAYYSILDAAQHVLTYASAGHNLALYAPGDDGAARPLTTAGIPLGIIHEAEFGQKTLALAPGDVVLFYTDGVSESMDADDEEFGVERLTALLQAQRAQPAESIADAIERAVSEFAGEICQYDDFTLLIVKRKPEHVD